ncbi:hypothetical protein SAMN04488038_1226 [Solimonas aquatica]|uniref:Beta-barrel porin 2 n=1 Tax=Solimonas aquatica TaxID=489703 RepID=A0A1H9MEA6_9GAMM|nr:hypothetical protein SAMN04488038_1226 [Solimonas aquatica]
MGSHFLNRLNWGLLGLSLLTSLPAAAEQRDLGIQLGSGWTLMPEFDAQYLHDSNIYRQDQNSTSANATILKPQLSAQLLSANDRYTFKYDGEFGFYDSTSHDNYTDNSIAFKGEVNQTGKNRLELNAGRREGHDPFGTERTELDRTTQLDVDEYALSSVDLTYTYGAPSATLNLSLGGDYTDKHYTNNKTLTSYLDFNRAGVMGALRFRLSNITSALADVQYHKISFPNDVNGFSNRDGDEISTRVGAQWQPLATLTMRGLVGYFSRASDASDRSDHNSLDWEGVLNYQPASYSLFVVEGSHSTEESYLLLSTFIDRQRVGGSWKQGWTDRLTTSVAGYYNRYRFEGYQRSDNVYTGSLYVDYDLSGYIGALRLVTARLSFDIAKRDSDVDGFDFDRNVTALRINIAL